MHPHPLLRFLALAVILFTGFTASQAAGASEIPISQGQITFTTGTAPPRGDQNRSAPAIEVVDADGKRYVGRWQVASVEASLVGAPNSMITFRPVTTESPDFPRIETDSASAARASPVSGVEASKSREPGFWAPALSTLALALFFFLRRLS